MPATPVPKIDLTSIQPASAGRKGFRYTIARYHDAIKAGIIKESDKIELIFGELIEKIGIVKLHGDCLDKINLYFVLRFGRAFTYRAQNPITLPEQNSEPEPDYAIINPVSYAKRAGNPEAEDVKLLIEIANASLEYDRTVKARLYALAGITEFWIINLQHRQLEMYLQPDPSTGEYNLIQRYPADGSFVSPFGGEMKVADLLPTI